MAEFLKDGGDTKADATSETKTDTKTDGKTNPATPAKTETPKADAPPPAAPKGDTASS